MLKKVVSPETAGKIDRYMTEEKGIPSLLLMEQAASALANKAQQVSKNGKITVVAGKGNNGGDGLAAARILLGRGFCVKTWVTSEDYKADAAVNFEYFKKNGNYSLLNDDAVDSLFEDDSDLIIDALFGTGLKRKPEGLYARIIEKINGSGKTVLSADIPSGVFSKTGEAPLAVYADYTVTFQYEKNGHLIYPGAEHTGELTVKKIGDDSGFDFPHFHHVCGTELKKRSRNTNKSAYGRVTVVAGSYRYSGAAVLCSKAALRAGAGLVTCFTDRVTALSIKSSLPEAMAVSVGEKCVENCDEILNSAGKSVLAIGPGLSTDKKARLAVYELLKLENKKIIDADAINILSDHPELLSGANCVITPHPKEFSRLSGLSVEEILKDPVKAAVDFAAKYKIIVLLKGASSVITNGKDVYIVTAGAPSMAKGGSGDVLTGVTASLAAQGYELLEAAYTAAYLCGKAGEAANKQLGDYFPTAEDTINNLFRTE